MFKPYKYTKISTKKDFEFNALYSDIFGNVKSIYARFDLFERVAKKYKKYRNSKYSFAFSIALSLVFLVSGIVLLLGQVLLPVAASYANSSTREPIINPLEKSSLSYRNNLLIEESDIDGFSFEELVSQANKHLALDVVSREVSKEPRSDFMYITIPKLDIIDAKVSVDSKDMDPDDSLGHYSGSCLPGDGCNSFIYGHSTYKYFKNKYQEGDYTGIFSNLDELTYGDEFIVKYQGKEYYYQVDFTRVQNPEEVDPLGSPYPKSIGKHESTVELFTCTPAGTIKYRLSVVGKLLSSKDIEN